MTKNSQEYNNGVREMTIMLLGKIEEYMAAVNKQRIMQGVLAKDSDSVTRCDAIMGALGDFATMVYNADTVLTGDEKAIRQNDVKPKPQDEQYVRIERDGYEVHWFRGCWEDSRDKRVFLARAERDRDTLATCWFGDVWRYVLGEDETYFEEDMYPEDLL